MPFYYEIDANTEAGRRTAQRLLVLRDQLDAEIPRRFAEGTLLLGTWNIREFDSAAYGSRSAECFYYIAEILSRFDLIAVQEVREDLAALDRVRRVLGLWWKYLVTDVTAGTAGNRERLAFLYDSRKVRFSGVAGEVVLPPVKIKDGRKTIRTDPSRQLSRSPFICSFQSGWFKFMLCTVHILYGTSAAEDPMRRKEIQEIANFLARRAAEVSTWSQNLILLGDFNIFRPTDVTFKALTDEGFVVPKGLQKLPANATKNKHYDQIAFKVRDVDLEAVQSGVFDYYKTIYTLDDEKLYAPQMGKAYLRTKTGARNAKSRASYYKTFWRTHQMSDHLPMWVELKTDFGREYLTRRASGGEWFFDAMRRVPRKSEPGWRAQLNRSPESPG